jgi:transcriptional regulator with XRE-family HTH domain
LTPCPTLCYKREASFDDVETVPRLNTSAQENCDLTESRVDEVGSTVDGGINIGERLRAIRNLRRYTLRQVAERAGLSESFLSQVERAQASASLASLQRIATALSVSISDLFEPDGERKPRVLSVHGRPVLSVGNLGRKYLLTPRPLDHLEVFICEFEPNGSTGDEPYVHGDSEELLFVLAGEIHLQLGSQIYELTVGESIDYRSSVPHRTLNVGSEVAQTMFIISPPSF